MGTCCSTLLNHKNQTNFPKKSIKMSQEIRRILEGVDFDRPFDKTERVLDEAQIESEYIKLKILGSGLFSKVFLVRTRAKELVAMKVIKKKDFRSREQIKKIVTEKELMRILQHRNILRLRNTFQTKDRLYLILEYAAKGNLIKLLNMKMYLQEAEIRVIVAQVIEGLMYIHSKGIIYGDLKAENVLVAKNGTIKLCDFNLSGTKSLLNDTLQGTVCYISPEMIEGQKRTHKSDFWSLGVLCHLLFYRKYPFKDSPGSGILKNILNRNIVKEPRDRKASPEFRLFLEELLMKDFKRRLGNRLEDFHQHPFYRGFDWENYFDDKKNFNYARNYNVSEDEEVSDVDGRTPSQTVQDATTFNYKIQGFTYDARNQGKFDQTPPTTRSATTTSSGSTVTARADWSSGTTARSAAASAPTRTTATPSSGAAATPIWTCTVVGVYKRRRHGLWTPTWSTRTRSGTPAGAT